MWEVLTPEIKTSIYEDQANKFIVRNNSFFEWRNIIYFKVSVTF